MTDTTGNHGVVTDADSGPCRDQPRRTRRDLSLTEIITVATEFLVDSDDGALTMRKLAAECGVTPMALYNHVDDKESLLGHVVDRVLEPVVAFDAGCYGSPRDALLDLGTLMRTCLLETRGAATTFVRRPVTSPTMAAVTERIFEALDGFDLGERATALAADAVVLITIGSIANDLTRPNHVRVQLVHESERGSLPLTEKHLPHYADRDGEARYRQALGWAIDGVLAANR